MRQRFDLEQVLEEEKRQRNKKSLRLFGFLTLLGITILLVNFPDLLRLEEYDYCSDKQAVFCSTLEQILLLLPILGVFGSLIWGLYLIKQLFGSKDARQELLERAEANAILQERVEGMPEWKSPIPIEELKKKYRLKKWLIYVCMIPLTLAIRYAIRDFWPDIDSLLLNMIDMMLFGTLIGLFPSREEQVKAKLQSKEQVKEHLQKEKRKADRAKKIELDKALNQLEKLDKPDSWHQRIFAAEGGLVFMVVMIGTVFFMERYIFPLIDWFDEFWGYSIYFFFAILGLGMLDFIKFIVNSLIFPIFKLYRPLRQGNYEETLQVVEQMERPKYWREYVRGTIFLFAGRYSKTEQIIRKTLIARQDLTTSKEVSLAMEALGVALMAQERYDEAIQVLEGAILVWPKGHESYMTLAEAYLFQGIEPQKALLLAQTAQRHKRRRLSWGLILDRYQFGEAWADQAWALALQGEHKEADRALKWAFRLAEKGYKPTFAGIHYRAGRTKQLMGDWPTAVVHYRNAHELDPIGHYGRLARQAVKKL